LQHIDKKYPKPKKGTRVYVRDIDAVFAWDGAEWQREPGVDFGYLITKTAKEFGWTPQQILDMTHNELKALFDNLPRVNCEAAIYTALAFNDPQELNRALEEFKDAVLTDRERTAKAMQKLKRVMGR
jgi:hypothetical protein